MQRSLRHLQRCCGHQWAARWRSASSQAAFTFTPQNFRAPELPAGLRTIDVPTVEATDAALEGYGHLISGPDEFIVEKNNFEIVQWPQPGWRQLDPFTGDEAGTTEGEFVVKWSGDFFFGHNLAVSTVNNFYLDGLGALPEHAAREEPAHSDGDHILLWMSDYHPE